MVNSNDLNPVFVNKDCSLVARIQNMWTIGTHIARGLEFMHARSYVHRDLKPSNGTFRAIPWLISTIFSAPKFMEARRLWAFYRGNIQRSSSDSICQGNHQLSSARAPQGGADIHQQGRYLGTWMRHSRVGDRKKRISRGLGGSTILFWKVANRNWIPLVTQISATLCIPQYQWPLKQRLERTTICHKCLSIILVVLSTFGYLSCTETSHPNVSIVCGMERAGQGSWIGKHQRKFRERTWSEF